MKNSGETFGEKAMGVIYDPFMALPEYFYLYRKRKKYISPLQGNILELGSGTGINFKLYSEKARVLAAEPSESMREGMKKRLQKSKAAIEVIGAGHGDEDLEKRIGRQKFDAVVSTLALCTIPDLTGAIKDMHRWMKSGAELIVLEHIYAKNSFGRWLQNTFHDPWERAAAGCHLNRPTDVLLKQEGFSLVEEEYFFFLLPFYVARFKKL